MTRQQASLVQSGSIDESFYARFKARAEELTVKVMRAAARRDALELILAQIRQLNIKSIVTPP